MHVMDDFVTVQIPGSVARHLVNIRLLTLFFSLYTAYRTNKKMAPVLKLEGIYKDDEEAGYSAAGWVSEKKYEASGSTAYTSDISYENQTNGRGTKRKRFGPGLRRNGCGRLDFRLSVV